MKNHASLVALLGIVFVILSGNAVVEGQSRRQMLIHRVAVDFVSDEILVFGVNFTAGKDDPSATLGGQPVDILGFEDTAVTLRLPPATAPGDYFLRSTSRLELSGRKAMSDREDQLDNRERQVQRRRFLGKAVLPVKT